MSEPKIKENRWVKELERPMYEAIKKNTPFIFDLKSEKQVFSIDTPPPYVNTPVHIGQATTYVLMDMFARYKRMKGYQVLFPLGLDRNGLPIELAAEREFKVRLKDLPREEAISYCKKILEKSSQASVESFLQLGISFNSYKRGIGAGEVYHTDSPEYRALTQGTFIDLWNKGLIYEDERINNYCPGCQTTLADAEVDYADLPTTFNDIIFRCKETGEEIIIGTTRPELVCTCGMIIFHPSDDRYQHLIGKHAVTPLFNKEVPIAAHTIADPEKGTGIVMMCSAGDTSDIRFFREMKLTPVIAINADGKMNEHAMFLKGLPVEEARKKMIEDLKSAGLLVKQRNIQHRTPVCERSKDPIEFISMKEYYLKQLDSKDKMKELAMELNFFADESRQIFLDWINSVSIDWPISRRRFYATEVPVWYCVKCGEMHLPPKGRYYQPWREGPPGEIGVRTENGQAIEEKIPVKCKKCGNTEFRGDERVFDTWFDSSISPLYILMYERDNAFFQKHQPCTLRPQGKEIIRTWLYYTVLKDYLLTGKLIFRDVWINYHIVDENGYKMSKSTGNVIDPQEVLKKFGAEPFRLWAAIEGNLEKTDFKCSFERIEGAQKTLVKLWNVARFVSTFTPTSTEVHLQEIDKWIRNEIDDLVRFSLDQYENYDFHNPGIKIKHFIWETFASHYLELVKNRAYNKDNEYNPQEQNAAITTLYYCLDRLLLLSAPLLPFITEKLYEEIHGKDIHREELPTTGETYSVSFTTDDIIMVNSIIWKKKQEAGKSLKDPVISATIPARFKNAERDIKSTHGIQKILYDENYTIEI
jgi:valyl-tRNA synthetase